MPHSLTPLNTVLGAARAGGRLDKWWRMFCPRWPWTHGSGEDAEESTCNDAAVSEHRARRHQTGGNKSTQFPCVQLNTSRQNVTLPNKRNVPSLPGKPAFLFRNQARAGEELDGFTSPDTAPGPGSRCTRSSPRPPAGRGTAGQTLCPADTVPTAPAEEVAGRTGAGLLQSPGSRFL